VVVLAIILVIAVITLAIIRGRRVRAELKARLKHGETDLVGVFADAESDPALGDMRVSGAIGGVTVSRQRRRASDHDSGRDRADTPDTGPGTLVSAPHC
jgi:hypothetical protein